MKRTNIGRRFQPETLTPGEVQRLLASFSNRPEDIRNRARIAVLDRTGLRIYEALTLYPKDLDLERGAIRVLNGKGGKPRMVGWTRARSQCSRNGSTREPLSASVPPTQCSVCATANRSAPSTSGSCCRGWKQWPIDGGSHSSVESNAELGLVGSGLI